MDHVKKQHSSNNTNLSHRTSHSPRERLRDIEPLAQQARGPPLGPFPRQPSEHLPLGRLDYVSVGVGSRPFDRRHRVGRVVGLTRRDEPVAHHVGHRAVQTRRLLKLHALVIAFPLEH